MELELGRRRGQKEGPKIGGKQSRGRVRKRGRDAAIGVQPSAEETGARRPRPHAALLRQVIRWICAIVLGIGLGGGGFPAIAATPISGAAHGPAIGGYDVVAYFTDGKPQKGRAEFHADWHGASWWFLSAEHRDRFLQMPERYAPQYGGYCAFAAAHGGLTPGSGRRWKIVDDKLYLNANWAAQTLWQNDIPGNIVKSDEKWPALAAKTASVPAPPSAPLADSASTVTPGPGPGPDTTAAAPPSSPQP